MKLEKMNRGLQLIFSNDENKKGIRYKPLEHGNILVDEVLFLRMLRLQLHTLLTENNIFLFTLEKY
jgi:hypothetical protein